MSVSVCVICFNEESNLRRCLDSVSWADEIVVVDSMSDDNTVEIARSYGVQLYQREWSGYVDQKNHALSKANEEWVLSLDADEEVPEALRSEIQEAVVRPAAMNGYRIPRRSYYQGRWINHSGFYPDRQLRLFRKALGRWTGGRVHERMEVQGSVGDLKNDLLHYPYQDSLSGLLRKTDAFTSLMAEDLYDRGKRYHLWKLIARPGMKFLEVYFLKLGFMDRVPGLIIATLSAFAMFVRYAKLRELEIRRGGPSLS
jgi:glycosyltransferase involved in cell wall biosynthesis